MGGFSAIASNNGWVIALLGISIVFTGLASLCLIISLFARILNWWNEKSLVVFVQPFKTFWIGSRR